ncbi:hypothetical protein GCM10022420_056720 [Streptomyces iranensis]
MLGVELDAYAQGHGGESFLLAILMAILLAMHLRFGRKRCAAALRRGAADGYGVTTTR